MPSTLDEQHVIDPGIFAIFKGVPNTGKSTGALSFPNAYVIDSDCKMPTIARKHFPGKKIDWDTFDNIFLLSDKLNEFLNNGCPYETIIADSITGLSTTVLNTVGMTKGEDAIKLIKTMVTVSNKEKHIDHMDWDYYRGSANFFERYFINVLRTLWAREGNPKHVILTAHVVDIEQSNIQTGKVTKTRQIVTAGKKISAFIPTRFDETYHFGWQLPELGDNLTKPKNICITSSFGEDDARTAYPFPEKIDFTGKSLYEEMKKYTNWS